MTQATAEAAGTLVPARSDSLSLWSAGLLYLALTLAATWPLAQHPASTSFRLGADSDLVLWILGWDAHAFLHQPFSIFDANIYYPERHTLAFAENLIGSALISAPVIWATGNVILGLNVVILASCALCGLGAYFLGRRVGMGSSAAFLAGAIFAFAPPRFGRLAQPHLNAVQWLPFALGALHGYLDTGRRRDLWLATAFFSLQVLSSGHGAVYATIAVAALLAYRAALGEPLAPLRRLRDFGLVGLLAFLPTVLVMLPYRMVQREVGLERWLTPDWAPPAANFVASDTHFHQYLTSLVPSLQINERATGVLFMGFLPIVLAVVAVWPRRRREARDVVPVVGDAGIERQLSARLRSEKAWRLVAALVNLLVLAAVAVALYRAFEGPFKIRRADRSVLFSVGNPWRPWLTVLLFATLRGSLWRKAPFDPLRWPRVALLAMRRLPSALAAARSAVARRLAAHRRSVVLFYGLLAVGSLLLAAPPPVGVWPYVYWLPGLNFIRVPARFTIVTLLALSVLAGLGLERVVASVRPRWRRILPLVAILVLAVEYASAPVRSRPYAIEIPAIDRWMDTLPKPFAIAEVPAHPGDQNRQAEFMLHSMAHWQKTVHAFSGFRTALHEDLYETMRSFPDEASLRALSAIKVDYVVVHTDYYDRRTWQLLEPRFAAFADRLRLVHTEGAGRVYRLRTEN